MKKILLLSSFIIAAVFVSGCLKVNTIVNVNNDGTGTVEETVFMSKMVIDMLSQFTTAFAEDTVCNHII